MKITDIILATVFTICALVGSSQNGIYLNGGVSLNGGHSQSLVDNDFKSKLRPGVSFGVLGSYSGFELGLGIKPRLSRFEVTQVIESSTLKGRADFNNLYLEIPLNYVAVSPKAENVEIVFGVYYGFGLSGKGVTEFSLENPPEGFTEDDIFELAGVDKRIEEDIKDNDYGVRLGFGYRISDKMKVRLQGSLGLSEASKEPEESFTQYSFGFQFLYNVFSF